MKKIKVLFIALAIIISTSNIATTIIAAENEESIIQEEKKDSLSEEEIKKQKQEILTSINSYLEDINHNIKIIDEEIENTKKQEEFDYYPAIRLNIDTPMFGMSSIVENKLRIKKDVSTTDVANKYSIRDVVEDKKIRLPESYIAGIVVSTKEVEINEDMSLEELKLTLVKCIQFESQVNAVDEFVDTQINKFFKDYIADEKKDNIRDVKDRSAKVKRNIEDLADKIYQMSFIGIDISDYITQYNAVSKELYNISKKSKNTLMSNSNLYSSKNSRIKAYIEDATSKKNEEDTTAENNSKITIIQNYTVTSENTEEYLEKVIEDIETKITNYTKEQESLSSQSTQEQEKADKTEEEKKAEETEKFNNNRAKLNELYAKYKEVLNRENKFYTDNINMLLNDSNSKMTSIIGQIDSDITIDNEIFTYTKYVYIDLPNNLSGYLERNNSTSMLELNNLNSSLYNELITLVQTNMNIKKMYEKMTEDLLKS